MSSQAFWLRVHITPRLPTLYVPGNDPLVETGADPGIRPTRELELDASPKTTMLLLCSDRTESTGTFANI